jgi:hypothetical protein
MPSNELAPGVRLEKFTDSSFLITEKSGRASVTIHRGSPPPTKNETPPFRVMASGNIGHIILNEDDKIVCWTTDSVMAALICKLLTLHRKVEEKQAGNQGTC